MFDVENYSDTKHLLPNNSQVATRTVVLVTGPIAGRVPRVRLPKPGAAAAKNNDAELLRAAKSNEIAVWSQSRAAMSASSSRDGGAMLALLAA